MILGDFAGGTDRLPGGHHLPDRGQAAARVAMPVPPNSREFRP